MKGPGLFAEPWPRVALVLAAFCFMHLTVTIPTDDERRKEFLERGERGIRRWIARLLVHRAITGEPQARRALAPTSVNRPELCGGRIA